MISIWHRINAVPKTTIIVVLGVYLAGGSLDAHALAGAGLASLLWLWLYLLNEAYDMKVEQVMTFKARVFRLLWSLLLLTLLGSIAVSWSVFGVLAAMSALELAYTHPRWRLKRYPWAAPILSGLAGPTLRFGLGVGLGVNGHTDWALVLQAWALLVAVHFPAALKTRVYRRKRDLRLGYQVVSLGLVRRLRAFQFMTPLGVGLMGLAVKAIESQQKLPYGTTADALTLAMALVVTTWEMNDLNDTGESAAAIVALHDMWKLRFWTPPSASTLGWVTLFCGIGLATSELTLTTLASTFLLLYRVRTYPP